MPSTPPPRRRLFRRKPNQQQTSGHTRTTTGNPLTPGAKRLADVSCSPPARVGCGGCFGRRPTRVAKRAASRSVRFSNSVSGGDIQTPKVVRRKSRGVRVAKSSVRRSASRRSFHSAYSTLSRLNADDSGSTHDTDTDTITHCLVNNKCVCNYPQHLTFDPKTPIVTPPDVIAGSYEELLIHAKSIIGTWATILERSDSLDAQMIHVGIGKMKRMVMNRLAIPFTAVLENNETVLRAWISTPVGEKVTTASLTGEETSDKDADLGDWTAKTSMVDYSFSKFCDGRNVRAIQMERFNPQLGTAFETKVVLPDKEEGRILLYNITIIPPPPTNRIFVDRVYRFTNA